ncbi:YhjD/YihY/BrkB family envelope integrity protein [Candidatus Binatus sp.]|uniref:YhjD/YihY/BrkB family envelope integrity protein n=1 Tax=Candidatus Binatus sp. TaxID=2811406 RepID=UPI002FD8E2F3
MTRRTPSWLESKTLDLKTRVSRHTTALHVWHVLNHAVEGFISNNDLLRASALTFTVALSIVPILALAFSAVKGFGGAQRLRPLVEQYLGLGPSSSQLMGYVENVNAAALGSAGGAFLLITVISTMGTVEQALNTIFNVPQSRSYFRKFSDYLSVLFTVPFLIVAALGVTAVFSVRISHFPFITQLLPYLFVWAGFFFLFVFFPYTKVKYVPALIGSFVTAVLFQLAQWGYVRFQVGVANYRAIYGAMATLPIFLVWIYIAWAVILFGAELTAAVQRGDLPPMLGPMSPDFLYAATMHILIRLADRAYHGGDEVTSWTLARELFVSEAAIIPILDGLKAGGFVIEADSSAGRLNQGLFLARESSTVVLADALKSVEFDQGAGGGDPRVDRVLAKMGAVRNDLFKTITLEDIRSPEAKAVDRESAAIENKADQ